MKRLLLLSLWLAAFMAVFALTSGTTAAAKPDKNRTVYIALGDSLAAGVGASDPDTTGYVPLVYDDLKVSLKEKHMAAFNLGHGGDTSTTLISHGHLATAVEELELRNNDRKSNNDVRAVTVDIGGNDAFSVVGVCAGGVTPVCAAAIDSTFTTFVANLNVTLGDLRAAAGPDTPIVVMTYYNPLVNPGCPLSALAPFANVVLEGEALLGLPLGLNDLIRFVAALHGAEVAELVPGGVFPALLGPADIQPDCLHANDAGYEIIADAFTDALDN